MPWDPNQYHRFTRERFAPFEDALALIAKAFPSSGSSSAPRTIVDLGCGTGELTARLADIFPNSNVVGVDSSKEMLAETDKLARPGLRFELGDIEAISGTWELVFSHAAIQWVDNHESLIPRLFALVAPGGQLVVQQPSNHGHVTHRLITELATESPFVQALHQWSRTSPVLSIERYAELLYASGGTSLEVFEKVYPHVLTDSDALADWTRGTALVPYFERMPTELHSLFMDRYRQRLRDRFPGKPVLYTFRRTLFSARRPMEVPDEGRPVESVE